MVKESILGLDKNERVIKEIKRHPIGLIEIYALAGFGLVAILGLLYFLLTNSEDNAFGNESLLVFGAVVALGLGAIGTPEDVIAQIERLMEQSNGGFGSYLMLAHEWANTEATRSSC